MRKLIFLLLVIFLASCKEEVVNDPPIDLLYLKSASADEEKVICLNGAETYRFPNDILFKIPAYENIAIILNNPLLLVEDYQIIFPDKATFTVNEDNSSLTVVNAQKLPFLPKDYAPQTENGDTRFNGVLKSKNFVFSINGKNIKILDLKSNFLTTTIGSISNDSFVFKVGTDILRLRLTKISPSNGNIFQLFVLYNEAENDIAYTLLRF